MAAFSVQDAQSQRFLPVENSPAPRCSISMGGKDGGYTYYIRIPLPSAHCVRSHLPQGDGFSGGGKVSGIAIRRPLGGAGERSEPEGVSRSAALSQKAVLQLPFAFTTPPVKKWFRNARRRF